MPIIEVKKKENSHGRVIVFECDQCGKIETRKYCKNITKKEFLFCSRECLGKSKKIKEKRKKTFNKNYDNQTKLIGIKEKCRQTCFKKYGVEHASQSEKIKEKCKNYFIEKYGVENPFQSDSVKEKCRQTSRQNYGVLHPMKSEKIKEKYKQTFIRLYSVENPFKSDSVKEKCRQTCLKKYGTEYPTQSRHVRSKIDQKSAAQKRHDTMKVNGTYGKSHAKDEYYSHLCDLHGVENVERQVNVNGWSIDFYIRSTDTYVQFDGVYWHGLDRPIEVIEEFKSPRDRVIHETYLRDRNQDEWFKKNGLTLVRVTDKN